MWPRGDRQPCRTAAWHLALPGILALAFGSAVVMGIGYQMLSGSIRSRGDAWLEAEVMSIVERVQAAGSSLTAAELELKVRELELHEGLRQTDREEEEQDGFFFLAVLAPGGRVSASAVRGTDKAIVEVLADSVPPAASAGWVHPGGWEYPVRVVSRPLADGRRVVCAATPYADAELLEEVRTVALVGWFVMLMIAAPAVWIEVRRVLARVDGLSRVAATISADALSRRLPLRYQGGDGDEIDRLAAIFNALLDRAAGAAEQLRTAADGMAHDLRTPLTAIRGTLEGALRADDEAARRAALAAAIADVDDLASLVDANLDTAEAEAGALRLRRVPLDLAELVRDFVELYEPAAVDRGLQLVASAPDPVEVEADEALLKRVLINLLDNALIHLPAGTRVIAGVWNERGAAVLAVTDDGPGFPEDVRARAFSRLVRGQGSPGRGLGLSIVRAVAVAHGGCAVIEQPPDGGSVVRVELPI